MTQRYCINCEELLFTNSEGDFCTQACADEYAASCDPRILELAREANPDAMPVKQEALSGFRSKGGELPPNTLDAVTSMLRIGGVKQDDIDRVMNIKPEEDKQ